MRDHIKVIRWMGTQARHFTLLLAITLLLEVILSLCGVGIAVITKALIDAAVAGARSQVLSAAVILAFILGLQVVLQAVTSMLSLRSAEKLAYHLQKNIVFNAMHTTWTDAGKYHSGDILTRLTSDTGIIANGLVNTIPGVISFSVQLTASFFTLLYFEPTLAIFAFVLSPAAILFSRLLGKRLKQMHARVQALEGSYRVLIQELLQNLPLIKAFCAEKSMGRRMDVLQGERLRWKLHKNRIEASTGAVLSFGYWTGYFCAFVWGAFRILKGTASFGTLAAFVQLVEQIQHPFVGLAYSLPQIAALEASVYRLIEFEALNREKSEDACSVWNSAGFEINSISFAYEQDKFVLKGFSACIQPGEMVAFTGPSGEGKTTLVRMLLAFIEPQEGSIHIVDGENGKYNLGISRRALIAYVPQGRSLLSGTIKENLTLGYPGASDEEIEKALRAAWAWDFIQEMPEGINTVIGEQGLGVSAGQAQRIAIARALLRKAPILVLDEATSELDFDTEMKIFQSIRGAVPRPTCIVITHRTEALKLCDKVFRLANESSAGRQTDTSGGLTN